MPATAPRPTQAHSPASGPTGAKPKLYNPRHPERTLLRQTAQRAWLGQAWRKGRRTAPHATGADSPHCGAGATTANAPAQTAKQVVVQTKPATTGEGVPGVVVPGNAVAPAPAPEPAPPAKRSPAHYLWAVLIARIFEVFPLLCPKCGGQMRLIAFITEGSQIRKILDHIGVEPDPPHISPARGPPLWDDCDAQMDEGVHIEPDWDLAAQAAPVYEVDQRISW